VTLRPVIFVLPQTGAAANGGIASISEVIARLRRYRAVILTNCDSPETQGWRSVGIETHVLPTRSGDMLTYWRYARKLRSLISTSGATVVHANKQFALQLAVPAVKLSPGTKLLLNQRDTLDPTRQPSRFRFQRLFGAADHVLFLSHDMADRWAKVAPNAKRSFGITYSIVDPGHFRPSLAYQGGGPPVVLISGIIRQKKGQLDFLRNVAPSLAAEGIHSWFAGDFEPERNTYMRACAEAAAPLGDAVRFLGYRRDMPDLIARAAVVVVPSRHEGLVRAMIEAMACARPVVSTDVCSAREILEQESNGAGTVVKIGAHQAMAEAIIRYSRNPELSASAGTKGRSTAARLFAPEAVVSRYERAYEALESGQMVRHFRHD
jgi:glycosyltransferase involved in cell wall biosynthesis